MRRRRGETGALAIRGEGGRIQPAIGEILDLIGEGDAVPGTGHLWAEEMVAIVARARNLRL